MSLCFYLLLVHCVFFRGFFFCICTEEMKFLYICNDKKLLFTGIHLIIVDGSFVFQIFTGLFSNFKTFIPIALCRVLLFPIRHTVLCFLSPLLYFFSGP